MNLLIETKLCIFIWNILFTLHSTWFARLFLSHSWYGSLHRWKSIEQKSTPLTSIRIITFKFNLKWLECRWWLMAPPCVSHSNRLEANMSDMTHCLFYSLYRPNSFFPSYFSIWFAVLSFPQKIISFSEC